MRRIVAISSAISKVELTRGYWSSVSSEDTLLIADYNWCLHRTRGKVYAKSTRGGMTIYMHRLVMRAVHDANVLIDHRDGDGLNNTRPNLRRATPQQNAWNSPGARGSRMCSARGVTFDEKAQLYRAYIHDAAGRRIELGRYESEAEAEAVRSAAAVEIHGDFAWRGKRAA